TPTPPRAPGRAWRGREAVASRHRMTGQEFACAHRTLAFRLDLEQLKRPRAGRDDQPFAARLDNRPGLFGRGMTRVLRPRKGRCGPRADQDQATAAKKAECVRPRMQSADQAVE